MKIIDSHAHLLHNHSGFYPLVESGIFDEIWLMDLSGVSLNGYETASRKELLQAAEDFKGRIFVFGFLDLEKPPEEIDRLKDAGFVGLKPYKPLHPYDSECYYPHYERAASLHMPILLHTGLVVPGPAWKGSSGHSRGPDRMRPGHLAGIAEAFPALSIMGGHLGWPYLEETAQNLYYYPNITHDISGYMRVMEFLPGFLDRRCHDGTTRFFNEKIRFATDSFYGSEEQNSRALRLREFWLRYFEFVGELYYRWGAPEEQEKFFAGTAAALRSECGF